MIFWPADILLHQGEPPRCLVPSNSDRNPTNLPGKHWRNKHIDTNSHHQKHFAKPVGYLKATGGTYGNLGPVLWKPQVGAMESSF